MSTEYATTGPWVKRAACITANVNMSMPERHGGHGRPYSIAERLRIQTARQVCESCPVLTECRAWALTTPDPTDTMIAGAMTPNERNIARGGPPRRTRRPAECGTSAGYSAHLRRGEKACRRCLEAHRQRKADYDERRRLTHRGKPI